MTTFARVSLTFDAPRGLRQPVHRKVYSFRATARSWRPEVNARQRCAPSGANVFGAVLPASAGAPILVVMPRFPRAGQRTTALFDNLSEKLGSILDRLTG